MPYLKRINSLPLINHISYKYTQVSDIGPSWSSCFKFSFGYSNVVSFESCCLLKITDKAGKMEIITRKKDFVNMKKTITTFTPLFSSNKFNFFKTIIP